MVMLFVGGSKKSFQCECKCNVFHHPAEGIRGVAAEDIYVCNACGLEYTDRGE